MSSQNKKYKTLPVIRKCIKLDQQRLEEEDEEDLKNNNLEEI